MTAKGVEALEGVDFIEVDPNGNPYFCDWYAVLVDDTPDSIIEALDVPMGLTEMKPCSGVPQYDHAIALWSHHHSDRAMFELSHGGNQGSSPHLVSKGYVAHKGMEVLRHVFPVHRVGRMDIAVDLVPRDRNVDLYDQISVILHELQGRYGLKARTINHDVPLFGRTHYLGSRQSPAMVRLYQKDIEQRSKGLPYIPGNVRLELESKPQKRPERARWATVGLEEAWGVSAWTKELAERVLSLTDVQVIRREPLVKRTEEETLAQIFKQHRKVIRQVGEERALQMLKAMFSDGTIGLDQDVQAAAA